MMDAAIVEAIGDALGVGVRSTRPVGGGDSSDAWRVELDDDTVVFAKTDPDAVAGLFASEADGLRRLAATGTVRVPGVLAVADRGIAQRFIVLGWIEPGRPGDDHDDELGRSLAAL
ncbi:MAG: fructosamine kinase family protein, partial [Acidimicrobiales bacterium]